MVSQAFLSFSVTLSSSRLGRVVPLGWLCIRVNVVALQRIPPDSSLSAALLLLFRNEKKFPNQKMSRFRVPIPYLQNLAVLLSMSYVAKFCRVQDFRLCSTTPPYAETAIASPRQSGICRAMSTSMWFRLAVGRPCVRKSSLAIAKQKSPETLKSRGRVWK